MANVEEGYQYFMRPEPRKHLGAVRLEYDDVFGRRVKVRQASIGMVRNAPEKSRKQVKVYLEPFPHIRIDKGKQLQGWYKNKQEKNAVRPRPCYTEAMLTEPYGGFCPIGCVHCYINSGMRGYRGTGLVTVPMDYGLQVTQQLAKVYRGSAGYITSFHDPFNQLEEVYHNSQTAASAFTSVGLPIFFLSRLLYPDWAIEALRLNKHSYAQKSMNTSSEEDWIIMSPGAASLSEHYHDIRRLKNAGVYVSVQVNPVIPGITSQGDIARLFKRLARAGADHVIVKFVECSYSWANAMVERLTKRFPDRIDRFKTLFTQNIGGNRTVQEEYRLASHKLFRRWAGQFGMTYSVCYEYRYARNAQGEVTSKTGISLGPELTTSAQCHGQRVPVYRRDDLSQPFQPIEGCPDSGCLYCADTAQEVPCGDSLMGEARALRVKELRLPWND